MHLLKAQAGAIDDGADPIDLEQTPGDIIVITSADTEIAGLARAKDVLGKNVPSLRLANILQLSHNFSVDLYAEQILGKAKLIVVRVLGGPGYWQYGLDEVVRIARGGGVKLAVVSGAAYADVSLRSYCTLEQEHCDRLWTYLVEGGPENFCNFLKFSAHLLDGAQVPAPAEPLAKAGLFWPEIDRPDLAALQAQWIEGAPVVGITFYRALIQGGDLAPVTALIDALREEGMNALPVYVASLKDDVARDVLETLFDEVEPSAIINLTGFAVSKPSEDWAGTPLDRQGAPVFQAILCGSNEEGWQESVRGLSARDVAMNVALPEIDGRIISRAISFKGASAFDDATQTDLVAHMPRADRVQFVAALAANWVKLGKKKPHERRVAMVLSNYPSSDGQIANGVGLDTPEGTLTVLKAMSVAGYTVENLPEVGGDLIRQLQEGVTNAGVTGRIIRETLTLEHYEDFFSQLPSGLQEEVVERWGVAEEDGFFIAEKNSFAISAMRFGETVLAIQPGRGVGLNAKDAHHDQTIVPPHGYIAFYTWVRMVYGADAVIHMGKHGNLEWLPGKAMALSDGCWPEAVFGPMPHIYPFIVNDPGEGTQAKRRTSAVIIDHLIPPLTRAESYGPLRDLEALVDEYYEASSVDPRRVKLLGERILDLAQAIGLYEDCGIARDDDEGDALSKLDNFLCDLKEMQIRNGLHIFGRTPEGDKLTDLLTALVRLPRANGNDGNASLTRALAADLGLKDFDPLDSPLGEPWDGARPEALKGFSGGAWRTNGDTVERLEELARLLVCREKKVDAQWKRSVLVLEALDKEIRPKVEACGAAEIDGVLRALDGRFVAPGPSGAPTRGRLDTLPTGRNFYSLDSRTVPTEAAWELGRLSAERVITAYRQDHGAWPQQFVISAWGTSNMRTGGDDIAQALAFLGVRPTWDKASRRISGYEILTLSELKRPRVDVVFRMSGFFRDAFPAQIDLLDSCVRGVAALNEPADANPIAARTAKAANALIADGMDKETALRQAGARVFGSRPGGYGAGLKDMIETGQWDEARELGEAYLQSSAYAYGAGSEGEERQEQFRALMAKTDAVIQNQDNREFDILDSADFFQFEGGAANAVAQLKGAAPAIYHNDHSNPARPVVRRLEEEIARIVRGRAANPKWIAAIKEHGYKGASDMAQSVTNLLGFAATTGAVKDHHFELLFEAYLVDPDTREFLQRENEHALREMSARFLEALKRGLWQPRRNSAYDYLSFLSEETEDNGRQGHERRGAEGTSRGEDAQAQGAS